MSAPETQSQTQSQNSMDIELISDEYIQSLTPCGMPVHNLILKTGATIMLIRNLSIKLGFCNGTRFVVTRMMPNIIEARSLTTGSTCFIPRVPLKSSEAGSDFILNRLQFPVRLAYCVTINKAQGQTLDKVGIYLPRPVFDHGQLYVGFSRVKSVQNIRALVFNTHNQGFLTNSNDCYTHNIVFRNILINNSEAQPLLSPF